MSELPEAIRGSRIMVDAYQFQTTKYQQMSISTTAFYGLGRDFASLIPDGCNAFTAGKSRNFAELDPAAQAYELKKQAQREAWHRQRARKNERQRIARGSVEKTLTEQVLRVNPHLPICEPSGFAVHKAEIRRELAKTKPAISAN